jgi:dTDP-4-dehydrorhamnose 3,5-epimerase
VLKGLNYKIKQPQGKLDRVIQDEIITMAVDLRRSSKTSRQWVSEVLSSANKRPHWVSEEFAHGFSVQSENAEVLYKTTYHYSPEHDRVVLWNDPNVGIDWPLNILPTLAK